MNNFGYYVMIYTEFGAFRGVEELFRHMVKNRISRIECGKIIYKGERKEFSMSLDELWKIWKG